MQPADLPVFSVMILKLVWVAWGLALSGPSVLGVGWASFPMGSLESKGGTLRGKSTC